MKKEIEELKAAEWNPVPLIVCEVCAFIWGITILGATTVLVGWFEWSPWTYLGAVLIMGSWTCKFCR